MTLLNQNPKMDRIKYLLVILSALMLTACGGGGAGGGAAVGADTSSTIVRNSSSSGQTEIAGTAAKGVIQNGIVTLYQIQNQSGVMQKAASALTSPVRTDLNGQFTVVLTTNVSGPVLAEVTADSKTTMICDDSNGCGKDASNNDIAFGQSYPLTTDFKMDAALSSVVQGKINTLSITPLTHMAVALANTNSGGLTADNISKGYADVESTLGLQSGSISLTPPDLSKLTATSNLSAPALQAALVSAAFLNLVDRSSTTDNIAKVLSRAETTIQNQGSIPKTSSANELATDKLMAGAKDETTGIAQKAGISTSSTIITGLTKQFQKTLETVASGVTITTSPKDVDVNKRQAISLSVVVSGTGPITYQWTKDGKDIAGATSATLSISSADVSDKGQYSVKVSNIVTTSPKATLPVSVTVHDYDALLSWSAPTTRVDGSLLSSSDIEGYIIRYGTDPSSLENIVTVPGNALSKSFLDLVSSPATYYFEIATLDSNGLQSDFSAAVSKQLM